MLAFSNTVYEDSHCGERIERRLSLETTQKRTRRKWLSAAIRNQVVLKVVPR